MKENYRFISTIKTKLVTRIQNFQKRSKIIGVYLSLADFFNLLDEFFYFKSLLRLTVKDSLDGLEILSIVDNRDELFRAKRIFTKEPGTIDWITNYFKKDDVFFDIGANIGVFSLFSAKKIENLKVIAFEPLALNYSKLNENIIINKLDKQVIAYNISLNDKETISNLFVNNFSGGASGSQYNSNLDPYGKEFIPQFVQGSVGFSLDFFIQKGNLPMPNHIKIDVDGNELLIIEGAKKTLDSPDLRTILIELFTEDDDHDNSKCMEKISEGRQTVQLIESKGFLLKRMDKVGKNLNNYLFTRD